MLNSLTRFSTVRNSYSALRVFSQKFTFDEKKLTESQTDYIKTINDTNAANQDWTAVKNNILALRGNLTHKNVDAVMLKLLAATKKFSAANSFLQHLKSTQDELPLGPTNSVLHMYYEMGKIDKLTKEHNQFILDTYKSLYAKYKVLDHSTCDSLLHALCAINEWEKALKVLENIHLSATPTHSAYSTLIATFFKLNKKKKALEMVAQSVSNKRPLQDVAYDEWINYILRKYKDKKTIAKYLDKIFQHIAVHFAVVSEKTANRFKELYKNLDWDANNARIRKSNGECSVCNENLDCLSLSDEEFSALQQNVKEKIIVGSDLLQKTTHEELQRFLSFVERTAPYDIVLDGLNICYAFIQDNHQRIQSLNSVVEHFESQNKKILLLGRKHMLRWNKRLIENIMTRTSSFFTDNLSQDDPFFITAAILSGPHTDIVSKDLLRGHRFNMQHDNLRLLFKRWQWQHQWMVFSNYKSYNIQPPLKFTPCAQKKVKTWHLPFESELASPSSQVNDGIPDLRSWICLRQK